MSLTSNFAVSKPVEMGARSPMKIADFAPFGRVPTASWMTRCISYPIGVRLAFLCHKARLSPNKVSVLSLLVGITTAGVTAMVFPKSQWSGLLLLVGLQIAYALDCADGVLARASGRCSSFGAIFDKTLDSISMILVPGLLCIGSRMHQPLPVDWKPLPAGWGVAMILVYATPRVAMAIMIWLKDIMKSGGDKNVTDERPHDLSWKSARVVAFFVDTPVAYLLLAVFWVSGIFLPLMLAYGVFSWVALLGYCYKSKRELG